MVSVPWLLPDLQKIINDYLTGHQLYNKCLREYKTKIHYEASGFLIIGQLFDISGFQIANYRQNAIINTNRNIHNFSRVIKRQRPNFDSVGVLPINY